MKYRLLGESGLRVSEASFGTTTFGDEVCPVASFLPLNWNCASGWQAPLSAAAP